MMIRFKTSAKVRRKSQNAKQSLQNLSKTFAIFLKSINMQLIVKLSIILFLERNPCNIFRKNRQEKTKFLLDDSLFILLGISHSSTLGTLHYCESVPNGHERYPLLQWDSFLQ